MCGLVEQSCEVMHSPGSGCELSGFSPVSGGVRASGRPLWTVGALAGVLAVSAGASSPLWTAGALAGVLAVSAGAALQALSRLLCCLASCSMVSSRWSRCSRSYCSARCHLRLCVSARSRKSRHAWAPPPTHRRTHRHWPNYQHNKVTPKHTVIG